VHRLTIRVSSELKEALSQTAKDRELSVAELIRQLLSRQIAVPGESVNIDGVPISSDLWNRLREFRLPVTGYPEGRKIVAIKEIREETGLGLREAKDVVDKAWPHLLGSTLPRKFWA